MMLKFYVQNSPDDLNGTDDLFRGIKLIQESITERDAEAIPEAAKTLNRLTI